MKNPLLSICIPTYNSSEYLAETLDSIVSQFIDEDISSQVEIIISDNASPDDTTEVVKSYQKNYKNIRYFRNEANLGASTNVIKVTEYANGEYLWLLTDNDCSTIFSLKYILRIIKETQFDVMLGNWQSSDPEGLKLFHQEFLGYRIFNGIEEFSSGFAINEKLNFHDFGSNFSLYSIFFVKRDFFKASKEKLGSKKLNEHLFPHSLITYSDIEDKIIVKPNNIFTLAMGHPSSWKHSMKIYHDFSDVFSAMLKSKKMNFKFKRKIRIFLLRYFIFNFIALTVNRNDFIKNLLKNAISRSIFLKKIADLIINPTI